MRPGPHRFWWGPAALMLALVAGACGGAGKPAGAAKGAPPTESPGTSAGHPTTRAPVETVGTTTTAPPETGPPETGPPETGPPATYAKTTTAKTTASPPTTKAKKPKPWVPTQLQPTISQAAYALVDAWAAHDRSAALRDATPAAVAAIFSYPYPPGGPQYRGCSTPPANEPAACVWRSGNDLLSLTVKVLAGGYAVTSATLES
ncbi:MAG: hypothetical protein M0005_14345 [Actinomycetota bacterium]|nr:hypothetical protein [Actinomycetota bacterium]